MGGKMEKTSTSVKENNICEITVLIKNTALIESVSGKTGLLNVKTNEMIGKMDNFYTIYDEHNKFYKQRKEICLTDAKKNSLKRDYILRIYDAEEERLIVDNWILEKSFAEYYDLCVLRSPINGKLHIFDKKICRMDNSIFDLEFDNVEKFYSLYSEEYLIVTVNGKKGIYCQGKGLIKPIEYDNIEHDSKVVVFTKGKEKGFISYNSIAEEPLSGFDEIIVENDNTDFVYCKIDNKIYVYNFRTEDLIFEIYADEIEFVCKNDCNKGRKYIFAFSRNEKSGLISAEIRDDYRNVRPMIETSVLLRTEYDEINYVNGIFYLNKNNKVGICSYSHHGSVNISAIYDKIEYLGDNFYAFYTGKNVI